MDQSSKTTRLLKPTEYGLGSKFKDYFPGQAEAIQSIEEQFRDGRRVVFCDGPVGCGKSLLATVIAKRLHNPDPTALVVVQTKVLGRQYSKDFPFYAVMEGRNNHKCALQSELRADEGLCRLETFMCEEKDSICPYFLQKAKAIASNMVVTNASFFLHEANYAGGLVCSQRDFLILDEGHLLENSLMDFVAVQLPEHSLRLVGLDLPKLDSPGEAKAWAAKIWPILETEHNTLERSCVSMGDSVDADSIRRLLRFRRMTARLKTLSAIEPKKWFLAEQHKGYILRPFLIDDFVKPLVTRHAAKTLLMSATFLNPRVMANLLGLDRDTVGWHQMDSNFPPERRPYNFVPIVKLSRRTGPVGYDRLTEAIDQILERHSKEKGIVHTASFKVMNEILKRTKYPQRFISHRPSSTRDTTSGYSRDEAIERFLTTSQPLALISPSMGLGLDLKDDLARWNVVAKCFTEDITFLGPAGEITINNAKKGQLVFTWENGHIITDVIQDVWIQDYKGPIWDLKARGYDLSITPNHDLLASIKQDNQWQPFEKCEAHTLLDYTSPTGRKRLFRLPQTVKWTGVRPNQFLKLTAFFSDDTICLFQPRNAIDLWNNNAKSQFAGLAEIFIFDAKTGFFKRAWRNFKELDLQLDGQLYFQDLPNSKNRFPWSYKMTDWLELLGWFVSEGSLVHRPPRSGRKESWVVLISQKSGSSGFLKIQKLLRRMGIPFWRPGNEFAIPSKVIYHALQHFGGKGAYNKFINKRILQLDRDSLRILFDAMTAGDGHKSNGAWYYYTVSEQLKWNVIELVYKLGYRPSLSHPRTNDWKIGIARHQVRGMVLAHHRSVRAYQGRIWCIKTRSGTLLAGRNGKWTFVGNCPFPNLGDPQIRYRQQNNPEWYSFCTIAAIIQATGRSTRHLKDWSTSYILDTNLYILLKKYPYLFPKWWKKAFHKVSSIEEAIIATH